MRQHLLTKFARRSVLKAAYASRLKSMKFLDVGAVDDFLRKANSVYHLYIDVYGSDLSERRCLVRDLVGKLGVDISTKVIGSIQRHLETSSPVDDWESLDWETALEFDGPHSVCELIRRHCRASEEATAISNIRPPGHIDHVRELTERDLPLDEWAEQFASVVFATGPGCLDKASVLLYTQADEVRHITSKLGRACCVLAYHDKASAAKYIANLDKSRFTTRPFEFRNVSKN